MVEAELEAGGPGDEREEPESNEKLEEGVSARRNLRMSCLARSSC